MKANVASKKIYVSKFNNGEITIKGLSNLQYDIIMDLVMSWKQTEYKHLIKIATMYALLLFLFAISLLICLFAMDWDFWKDSDLFK